ncbi:hypothetical protein HHK36_000294 [Tetracentron sinense]|uniref:DNA-directed RNA polymerase subunit n=1 Tax=Tetracentron sinense TaxID=13715 RepID=A0A834ZTV3_TETSI|nr:hypothetical protein HHK36_000294 [Tetracentron sinense]
MDDDMYLEQELPSGFLTGIKFNVLTKGDLEKYSVIAIDAVNEVTDPKLGVPNPSSQCSTCSATDIKNCDGHAGIINLPMDIFHPYFVTEIIQILNRICPGCKSIRQDLRVKGDGVSKTLRMKHCQPKGCKYCVAYSKEWYPTMRFKVASKDLSVKNTSEIIVEVNEKVPKKFGNKNLSEVLPTDYWDFICKDSQQEHSFLKPNRRALSPAQVYNLLKDVDLRFIEKFVLKPESLFLSCFPVTPNCHRVMETVHMFSNGHKLIFDERTKAYKRLVDFKGQANELGSRVLDCLNLRSENSSSKYPSSSTSGLKWVKEVVLGKRSDNAFRMIVVGDPKIKLTEIGIPRHISERLLISEYLNSWNWEKLNICCNLRLLEKGEFYVRRKGNLVRICRMNELQIGDTVYRSLDEGDLVLINRPPSIHQHSLIALSVKVLPINSVVSINPLCCSPFRGDFDGDCLHGYIPQSIDSRVELRELVALDKQLINGQNGRNLLSLSQDSLTAAHLVRENGVFLNRFQMQQLENFCPHQLQWPAFVKAPSLRTPVWTGKQLFSMLLPPCFDFSSPPNGVEIRKGELLTSLDGSSWLRDTDRNIYSSLVERYQGKALDFLFAAQEVLCEWLSMRGFSVSLSDMYLSPDSFSRKCMIDEVSCGLQEAEKTCHIKQLMVDSGLVYLLRSGEEHQNAKVLEVERMCHSDKKSSVLGQVLVDGFKEVFHDIQNLIYQYASKDNSMLAMVKAGSKGNLLKLVQQGVCLGLQRSPVLSLFRFPRKLSCAAWNRQKVLGLNQKSHYTPECAESNIPYSVIESSFLTGLNPLECFVHSVSNRNNCFSENADLPGTLTRKLMFYLRDLYIAYDGTVRNAYGNQLVQFSYGLPKETSILDNSTHEVVGENAYACDAISGQPVGSLSACSISEAAYSALDQPISSLEMSPLLNLKKVLECGPRKTAADQTISLFLSKKLRRWIYGFEYGAIEVKRHLERVLFSDVVSTVMIIFSPQTRSRTQFSPWVCHFHICEETAKRRRLDAQSIVDALKRICNSSGKEAKLDLPKLQISSKDCSAVYGQKENNGTFCITVAAEISKGSPIQLDTVRDLVIPFLLRTVIKGFVEFKNVDILWNDLLKDSKSHKVCSGELYLRVSMSEHCEGAKFWSVLQNACLQIMDLIDWERSHPDNIYDTFCAYGIDAAWIYFLTSLKSAISETGKTILPEHLLLVADSLSATGEFIGLSAKGLRRQRNQLSVSSPFMQACFSNPGACFIKAAKEGTVDGLQGTLDAVAWGKKPSIGTGGHFDILYSGKGHNLAKPEGIYDLLCSQSSSQRENIKTGVPNGQKNMSDKCGVQSLCAYGDSTLKGHKSLEFISSSVLRSFYTLNDIRKMSLLLKLKLHRYPINHCLSEADKSFLMTALYFHPHRKEKIGSGLQDIKVGYHSEYQNSRCFLLVRTDGTIEDFSYHKCVRGALEIISPQIANNYGSTLLKSGKS